MQECDIVLNMDTEEQLTEKVATPAKTDIDSLLRPIAEKLTALETELEQLRADSADTEETINYYKKAAATYKSKLQARELMEVVLPYISDMLCEINEQQNMDDLRMFGLMRLEELIRDLEYIGVTVKMHEKGSAVDPSYICNIRPVPTEDGTKIGTVAKCTQIGCEFRDGTDPILECLDIYSESDS